MSGNRAIAVFGGTFDPVHYGHLRAAVEVAERLGVPDFRLMPAGQPPHREATWAPARHRLAMLELALAPHQDLRVDDREVRREGPSYMVDTLESIRREEGLEVPLLLCVGQDAANELDRWHDWKRLFELAHIVIMARPRSRPRYAGELKEYLGGCKSCSPGEMMESPSGRVCSVEITRLAISSTDIRRQLAEGRDPRFLLPATVLTYIRKHHLYGT